MVEINNKLDQPNYFNNREISWLRFNQRVLEEAINPNNPILERLRFISIFSSNLDEFFMVRVAGLKDQVLANFNQPDNKSGMTAVEQLKEISHETHHLIDQQQLIFLDLMKKLNNETIELKLIDELSSKEQKWIGKYFYKTIFPILTPLSIQLHLPFPLLANRSLNIAVKLVPTGDEEDKVFVIQIPELIDRTIQVLDTNQSVFIEDLIIHFLAKIFPDDHIQSTTVFRITRNADMTIHEEASSDLLTAIESELDKREWGAVVRLEVAQNNYDEDFVHFLKAMFEIEADDIYFQGAPLDFTFLDPFYNQLEQSFTELTYPEVQPQLTDEIDHNRSIFEQIKEQDILLHHPYDSFETTIKFMNEAALDPNVLAIKQTLYRASKNSPIIKSLETAAKAGKQVTVLVELKARFDEQNNVQWARKLERAGCRVIYGITGFKTHSKMSLIVRKNHDKVERFVHLSTGNYNEQTATLYTDLALMTARKSIVYDATHFYNFLSGAAKMPVFKSLSAAPDLLHDQFLNLIDQEIQHQEAYGNGKIIAKMNALTDKAVILKLYQASQAGVSIDLIVRGICSLKPGIPGVSDHIRVSSIVGRFLEHSRIYYFFNNGEEKYYLSSADWMTRNLQRRVELLFPVLQGNHQQRIQQILELSLKDNTNRRIQGNDGTYKSVTPNENEPTINSQYLFQQAAETRQYD